MKKRTAIIGSSVLGVAAAVAVAAPANAIGPTITTPCTNVEQHVLGTTGGTNWYMDCIPQYGAGKAEFSIAASASDPTATFPTGFEPLSDSAVPATASVDTPAGAAPYFAVSAPTKGFLTLEEDTADSTASKQTYEGVMIYKIASVQSVAISSLPADCATTGDPYLSAWEVTYEPATVTYDETVGGDKYQYTVTSAPQPLFLGLPLDPAADNGFNGSATASFCASDGTNFIQAEEDSVQAEYIYFAHATVSTDDASEAISLAPYPDFDEDSAGFPSTGLLGTFDPTVTPILATTGVDPMPAGLFGTGLAILGAGAVVTTSLRRRRSRRV